MPTTITTTLYQYDELTPDAQEKAREWFREGSNFTDYYGPECVEECVSIAKLIGIDINPKTVYYSVGGYQGDGACFTGSYSYAKGAIKAIEAEYCPEFIDGAKSWIAEPIQTARALQQIQRKHFYRLYASTRGNDRYHSQSTSVDHEYNCDLSQSDCEIVEQAMIDFAGWIYTRLNAEHEYRNSDEQIVESIRANEYTFTDDGEREYAKCPATQ